MRQQHMSAIVDLHAIYFSLSLSLSLNTRVSFVFLLRLLDRREEELGMDTTLQWHQGMALGKAMEEFGPSVDSLRSPETAETKSSRAVRPPRKEKPPLKCPRCNSSNTKFCYYNNYSLTQPRYFCKACRRYWTEGGSLRNVPVGGGSRKNKKPSSSSSSSAAAAAAASISTPKKYPAEYLNLSATTSGIPQQCVPPVEYNYINGHCSNFAPFLPMMSAPSAAAEFLSGFGVQELLRPPQAMSFPMDGVVNVGGYGAGGKLQFPLADEIKPAVVPSSGINVARQLFDENNNRQSDELPPPAGFWTGLMNNNAGGPW